MESRLPKYTDSTIAEIKSKLRISELVQSYIPVINKGGRLWAKCPFHGGGNERTPSFAINDTDGFYHCFGCHESGDMFTFLMKMEKLSFSEAVEALAARAGVELEKDTNPGAKKSAGEAETLYDLNQRLQGTFHHLLVNSKEGEEARRYLERRKVSSEMIERFQLGYAPKGSDWLYNFLSGKGYSDEILRKSGLFSQNHFPYSLFQDRLVFPVRNRGGKTIGFSGRDLSGKENVPKYVNSPDTPVYSKKHNFFGLYEALDAIKKGAIPVLVEGNFDVVAMHQAGISSAIASLGTSFTEEQALLIARYAEQVDVMFDSDEAGQKSTDKALLLLHSKGIDSSVHQLSSGKDASEIVEKEGENRLSEEFSTAQPAFEYLVRKHQKMYNINLPRGKSEFLTAIAPFVQCTVSDVEKDGYISYLARLLSVSEEAVRKDIASGGQNRIREEREQAAENTAKIFNRADVSIDLFAMLYLANHRKLFRQYRNRISFADLTDTEAKVLYVALENAMRNDITSNELFLSLINDEKTRNDAATSFELDEYRNGKVSALDEVTDKIALRGLEAQRKVLSDQLSSFSTSMDKEQIADILRRKSDLDHEIAVRRGELYKRTQSED